MNLKMSLCSSGVEEAGLHCPRYQTFKGYVNPTPTPSKEWYEVWRNQKYLSKDTPLMTHPKVELKS